MPVLRICVRLYMGLSFLNVCGFFRFTCVLVFIKYANNNRIRIRMDCIINNILSELIF